MKWLSRSRIVMTEEGAKFLDLLSRDFDGFVQYRPDDTLMTGGRRERPEIAIVTPTLGQEIIGVEMTLLVVDDSADLGWCMGEERFKELVVCTFLDQDRDHRRFVSLVMVHEVEFHGEVLLIDRVLAGHMEMELFEEV